jgi:hypothetical protein
MNNTNLIIFSKNRSCQLELLLRSMSMYWKDFDNQPIKVIYKYDNEYYKKGYEKLISKSASNVQFIPETVFRQDVLKAIDPKVELTIFGVDDDVFIREFDLQCEEVSYFKLRDQIITLSLRLGKHINYCYTQNKYISRPALIPNAPYKLWDWTGEDQGDWNYPFSLDFHLYRTKFILPFIQRHDFRSPNTMEGFFARIMPYANYLMMGFDESKVVNIPCNKVQVDNRNKCGNITAEYLNRRYLGGQRIKYESLDIHNKNACHVETDIKFMRKGW